MMPTVAPASMWRSMSERVYSFASFLYLKDTWSKSICPSGITWQGFSGSDRVLVSSKTWLMRRALARDRVSMRNTLDIIMRELTIWST